MTRTRLDQITDGMKLLTDKQNSIVDGATEITAEISERVDHFNSRMRALEAEREKIKSGELSNEPLQNADGTPLKHDNDRLPIENVANLKLRRSE